MKDRGCSSFLGVLGHCIPTSKWGIWMSMPENCSAAIDYDWIMRNLEEIKIQDQFLESFGPCFWHCLSFYFEREDWPENSNIPAGRALHPYTCSSVRKLKLFIIERGCTSAYKLLGPLKVLAPNVVSLELEFCSSGIEMPIISEICQLWPQLERIKIQKWGCFSEWKYGAEFCGIYE